MSDRRDLNTWMAHHPAEALFAAALLFCLTVVACVNPSAELGFVLQTFGAGGALGLVVSYARFRDDPEGDRWRTVAQFSVLGLMFGILVVGVDALGLI